MTRIISRLSDISGGYDVLYCDLWGCLHNGRAAFPEAVAALQQFRAGGGRVVLLTNAPRPSGDVHRQLDRLGVPQDAYDLIVSSGDATQEALFRGVVGRRVWHLGPAKDDGLFTDIPDELKGELPVARVPLAEADGIVCTGPFDDATEVPEDYRDRFLRAKAMGLRMLCANPDIVVDLGEKRLYCAGALAGLYQEMGGEVLSFGKPYPPVYDLARRRVATLFGRAVSDDAILAIGDGIGTDIAGAQGEGIDAIFVTGGLEAARFGADGDHPDPALLEAFLAETSLAPLFAIGHLR